MSTEAAATYGTYDPHFPILKEMGCTPSELAVFGKLVGLAKSITDPFIHLGFFAEELHYRRETISRSTTKLEKKGFIKRTGKKKYGIFPVVEIMRLPFKKDPATPADNFDPSSPQSSIDVGIFDAPSPQNSIDADNFDLSSPQSSIDVGIFDDAPSPERSIDVGGLDLPSPMITSPIDSFDAPLIKRSTVVDQEINARCPNDQTHEIKTDNNKKQTQKIVCEENILLLKEKLTIITSLKKLGMGKKSAQKLITRFDINRVQEQIEHLRLLLERGDTINNPAGWITAAIKRNFKKPLEVEKEQNQILENAKAEQQRRAGMLIQEAEYLKQTGKLEEAKKVAQKSLDVYPFSEAKKLIEEIEKKFKTIALHKRILEEMPKEEFAKIVAEEAENYRNDLRRVGITQWKEIYNQVAHCAALERIAETFEENNKEAEIKR
jgi:hypothetical protein